MLGSTNLSSIPPVAMASLSSMHEGYNSGLASRTTIPASNHHEIES